MAKVIEDASYFIETAKSHELKLYKLADVSETFLNKSVNLIEEYKGLITSTVGKTKLLVNEKFDQFYGLCNTYKNPIEGEMSINSDDLAGFWDLIMIEVRLLYKSYKYIADRAKENWKKPLEDVEIVEVKRTVSKTSKKSFPAVKSVIGAELKKLKNQTSKHKSLDEIQILWQKSDDKMA